MQPAGAGQGQTGRMSISNNIEQIKKHDPHTAAALKTIVHDHQFRRHLNLL
jgi:hypothetical protein